MKYTPAPLQAADLGIAEATFIGCEFAVGLAEVPAVKLAVIEQSSSGNGSVGITNIMTYTPRPGAAINGAAADLVIVATGQRLLSKVACTVTLNVVDDLGATTTATATFQSPARATNQGFCFPRGTALDLTVATGPSRKIASISGVAGIVGGQRGNKFLIMQLPELADYVIVGDTTALKFNVKAQQAVGISVGKESDKYVKLGRTTPGMLTIDSKMGSMMDGLTRFNGAITTAIIIGVKEDVVLQSNYVFSKYIPTVEVDLPEGDSEAVANAANGKYQEPLIFEAL